MLKPFDQYTLEVWASVDRGLAAQILCHYGDRFVGRIDFYADEATPVSYLWHPNGVDDPDQIYIVLAMPAARFDPVEEILRIEGPMALELYPRGELSGAATDGYGGVLRSLGEEPISAEQRRFYLAPRPEKTSGGNNLNKGSSRATGSAGAKRPAGSSRRKPAS